MPASHDPDQGIDKIESPAPEIDLNDADAHNRLGNTYAAQKRYAEAEQEYQRALQLAPNSALYHCNLGELYYAQQRYVEAEEEFKQAIEIDPNHARAYNGLGL